MWLNRSRAKNLKASIMAKGFNVANGTVQPDRDYVDALAEYEEDLSALGQEVASRYQEMQGKAWKN